jgi:hypothetical protein
LLTPSSIPTLLAGARVLPVSLALALVVAAPLAATPAVPELLPVAPEPREAPPSEATGPAQAEQQRDEVTQALYDLVDRDPFVQRPAARYLRERGGLDAVPFMVTAMRYQQFRNETLLETLVALTGQDFGSSFEPWAEWMVRERIAPHPAFRQWQADFLARLNPRFGEFLDPERPSTIEAAEIQWGGVAPEGIPSLDDPAVTGVAEAGYLADDELVFGVALAGDGAGAGTPAGAAAAAGVGGAAAGGTGDPALSGAVAPGRPGRIEARAYPLRILDWHEMTNDVVAGVPVALSYCTLCGSGVLFDRRIGERTFTFATSGLLYRSNKLMFDHETETLWSNLTGKPVLGPLVGEDLTLRVLPLVVTTWGEWRREYPGTTVLSLETGYDRDYRPGQAYGEYFASPDTMFPVGVRDDRLPAKAWVFAIRSGEAAMAFELEALQQEGVLNTRVGEQPVVLVVGGGRAVRAYERGELAFDWLPGRPGETTLVASDGSRWRVSDVAMYREGGGGVLNRLPGHLAYWFGWYAFFPDTGLWTGQ